MKHIIEQLNASHLPEKVYKYDLKSSHPRAAEQVNQYTLDMTLVGSYPNARAANQQSGVRIQQILASADKISKQAGGFKWRYMNEVN